MGFSASSQLERKSPAGDAAAFLVRLRPAAIHVHRLDRAETQLALVVQQGTVENHLQAAALGQHGIGTARYQHADQARRGARRRTDARAHAVMSGGAARQYADRCTGPGGFADGARIAAFVALALDLALGLIEL